MPFLCQVRSQETDYESCFLDCVSGSQEHALAQSQDYHQRRDFNIEFLDFTITQVPDSYRSLHLLRYGHS